MKSDQAKQIRDDIKEMCKKYGLYYEIAESNKPCLKNITITVNVKVDEK